MTRRDETVSRGSLPSFPVRWDIISTAREKLRSVACY